MSRATLDSARSTNLRVMRSHRPPTNTTHTAHMIRTVCSDHLDITREMTVAETHYSYAVAMLQGNETPTPNTYNQAIQQDKVVWGKSMDDEMQSMRDQKVFQLVDPPPGANIITVKWVYKIKLDANNQPAVFKSRLVARGFMQKEGIDYNETFAPVVNTDTLHLLFGVAAYFDLEIFHADFTCAFLNMPLKEKIYCNQPKGYAVPGKENKVFLILKAIYGLKQSPMEWNKGLDAELVSRGYVNVMADRCVYVKRLSNGRLMIIAVYVDDMLCFCKAVDEPIWIKDLTSIGTKFPLKNLGQCKWFLNMKVIRDRKLKTVSISQEAYIKSKLVEFNLQDCKPSLSPHTNPESLYIHTDPSLSNYTQPHFLDYKNITKYQQMIGSLMYLTCHTRAVDLGFATTLLARSLQHPTDRHLTAATKIFKYLQGTQTVGLTFNGATNATHSDNFSTALTGDLFTVYTDSDWAGDMQQRKSTTGNIVLFNGSPIYAKCSTQHNISISSTESEIVAACTGIVFFEGIRNLVREIFDVELCDNVVYIDNQAAIQRLESGRITRKNRHIEVKIHHVKQQIDEFGLQLKYVKTTDNLADILTKDVTPIDNFIRLRNRLLCTLNDSDDSLTQSSHSTK